MLSNRLLFINDQTFFRVIGHVAADHVIYIYSIYIFLMSFSTVQLHLFLMCLCTVASLGYRRIALPSFIILIFSYLDA